MLPAASAAFNLSNTLGSKMVLQSAPQSSLVWGHGDVGVQVTTMVDGRAISPAAEVGRDGIWRQHLPPTPASKQPHTITFRGSDGGFASLNDVLFGEVFLCSGQSNMAYTPLSMAGMNNASAEIAAADAPAYHDVRLFTVGQGTTSKTPRTTLGTVYHNWTQATAKVVGGKRWKEFSAVCWLFGREIHDALNVPVGLISASWGGTSIQVWMPSAANEACNQGNWSGEAPAHAAVPTTKRAHASAQP